MLNVHRSHIRFVRDGWRYLQRPKRPSATARTINVKEVRNRAKQLRVLRDLFFSTAVRSGRHRQSSKDRLLKPEAKDNPVHYEGQLHLPLDHISLLGYKPMAKVRLK